ncbi:potassium-transporting ATPase subunit KdpA [Clostridium estertheticum]|uniref:potassium-transporting ATPase subunit KdpA n=1 Tax=Clostridium estertheticum TaxID=238834 RepID=UPI001C7D936C|nr:potassium-transporting ATPase subunit KdpA [Clostridium estertheticum]MBX4266371.1 potassium-transporting ATPase subunit KdpA [Clostridium estertheticum]WLC86960.1 potassium-transporting ATPase subunit KdpA [Clostridium estertheticum]
MDVIQIIIPLIIFVLIIIPLGRYVYNVISGEKSFVDPLLNKVDNLIFKVTGIKNEEMNWKTYVLAIIISNAIMCLCAYIILRIQNLLFLNPNNITAMKPDLSFNTAISFITNTNLQGYAGESGVSYLSQMVVMTFLMFTSASTGFAAASAFMRGIIGRKKTLGNFFIDMTRIITRILLPLSIFVTVILVSQGVPQTLAPNKTITTIESKYQDIAMGPVASLESIKHIGTNGGGFFNANSAHPFENPTTFSNLVELLSMMVLPGALVMAFGLMLKNKKQSWMIFITMGVLLVMMIPVIYMSEKAGNPNLAKVGLSQVMGNMEGKEVRFGIAASALFTTVTTAFTTGTVNTMHDSLMPLGGLVPLWNMMLNVVFGGKGVGFMNMMMYAIITVFIAGLMVGRTPEFLGKKIEGKEIKLIAIAILVHPLIILFPSAVALTTKMGLSSITNPGFHGLTETVYQFTSAAANNGSAFAGFNGNTMFANTTTGIVMLLGRYLSIIILLAVAGSLASKHAVPETMATFRTDNSIFVVILISVVIIIGALTFLPALTLGPIAEHLMLGH